MAQEIKVNASLRDSRGTTAARRIRRSGTLPAVLSKSDGETVLLGLDAHEFELMLSRHAGDQHMVTLTVDSEEMLTLLSEIQRHSVTGKVIHADFHEIRRDRKLRLMIPIVLVGEPDGVRNSGGIMDQSIWELDVSCFPGDVVESFEVDVTDLKIGETMLVGDLGIGEQFEIETPADTTVVSVALPRVEEESSDSDEDDEGDDEAEEGDEG